MTSETVLAKLVKYIDSRSDIINYSLPERQAAYLGAANALDEFVREQLSIYIRTERGEP